MLVVSANAKLGYFPA